MTTSYITRPLICADNLKLIENLLSQAEWSQSPDQVMEFYPGYQDSSEMAPSHTRNEIERVVMSLIATDQSFHDLTFPKQSTRVIVSNTEVDQGFKIHHDNVSVGDFSTTVFLSDPDTYEGGELCIHFEGNTQKFKLAAGQAITYSTGAPHCVLPVKSGVRQVAVFWTTSSIRDPRHRDILSGLRRLRRTLPVVHTYDFEEISNSPEFILLELENKYSRYFLQ